MKVAVALLVGTASAVPYSSLPAGVVAPSGYADYIPDPNLGLQCVPEWQACGHEDWSKSGVWDYGTCCDGTVCDSTYTCMVDPNAGAGCSSNQPPAGVQAPAGYCDYKVEYPTPQAQWAVCGHQDWNIATNWAYSTCVSGFDCVDQGSNQWACMAPVVEWSADDKKMMCSCCKNSCGFRVTYDCIDTEESTCGAYGSQYTWCDDSMYDETACAGYKEIDQLNWYTGDLQEGPAEWPARVYAPYLDGGLYPILKASELQAEQGINYFILAFVVAKQDDEGLKCIPDIGAVQDVRTGPMSYNETTGGYDYFWAEVDKVRKAGGDVSVSFGGAMNTELADCPACAPGGDVTNLVNAYDIVISSTKSNHIDFDVEGAAAASTNRETGWTYRFQALIQLAAKYPNLKISFTLPVLSTGLTEDGLKFVELMMQMDAPWDYFNMMTMDYGDSGCDLRQDNAMGLCEVSAIKAVAQQMLSTAKATGKASKYGWSTVADVYPKLGSTPMIGLNDLTDEMYTQDDAKYTLSQIQSDLPIRLWSSWSIWRDQPCTLDYVDTKCTSRGPQPGGTSSLPVAQAQTSPYEYTAIQKQVEA